MGIAEKNKNLKEPFINVEQGRSEGDYERKTDGAFITLTH